MEIITPSRQPTQVTIMSFQERLQQALDKAPAKEVYNGLSKPYTWDREANQKRCVR